MKKLSIILILIYQVISIGCVEETTIIKNSITDLVDEPKGGNCISGGIKVITGMDDNNNEILDEAEIENVEYICNGNDGVNGISSLLDVVELESSDSCLSGGYKVLSGLDLNQDSMLDEEEIQQTEYICNGTDGVDGGYDKQVVLKWDGHPGTSSTNYQLMPSHFYIRNFDIRNYTNVDSVVFTAYLGGSGTMQLYDVTNKKVIANSTLSSNSTRLKLYKTVNLINELPQEPIVLAIRLKTSQKGYSFSVLVPKLILYRK